MPQDAAGAYRADLLDATQGGQVGEVLWRVRSSPIVVRLSQDEESLAVHIPHQLSGLCFHFGQSPRSVLRCSRRDYPFLRGGGLCVVQYESAQRGLHRACTELCLCTSSGHRHSSMSRPLYSDTSEVWRRMSWRDRQERQSDVWQLKTFQRIQNIEPICF